jgi:DNA processing protein
VCTPTRIVSARHLGLASSKARYELAGDVPAAPRLALVGSRAAERRYCGFTDAAVALAGRLGWSVISGGALGIDGAAHRAALTHGVAQLAVAPLGPDQPYPRVHVALFEQLATTAGSGVLFAQPRGARATRGMFASRNAIVVGLASAVIVVQAASRSGSIGTGQLAMKRGVPVAAVIGTSGCGALIGRGARPLRIQEDVCVPPALEAWLRAVDPRPANKRVEEVVTPACTLELWPRAHRWLGEEITRAGAEGLCLDALPDPCAALVAIVEAESLGLIVETTSGRYHLVG